MKVTPVNKKFGKYAPGEVFDFPDLVAKVFIKRGKLQQYQTRDLGYQTRMMAAAPAMTADAPYGLKKDGTPKARPGRKVIE